LPVGRSARNPQAKSQLVAQRNKLTDKSEVQGKWAVSPIFNLPCPTGRKKKEYEQSNKIQSVDEGKKF